MSIIIEISFDLKKIGNISEKKADLEYLALKYKSINNYFMHEVEGTNNNIEKNKCINIIEFDNEERNNFIKYVKDIIKLKEVNIDCIYKQDFNEKILLIYKKEIKSRGKKEILNLLEFY